MTRDPAAPRSADPMRDVVCVLGMHRSGTSLVARLLDLLGWSVGPDDHLIAPAPDNPTGFWENRGISEINREILRRLGGSWRDVPDFAAGWESAPELADLRERARDLIAADFGRLRRWAWKDPRACLTLPFWRRVIPRMRYVLVVRDPAAVSASLAQRTTEPVAIADGPALWLTYVAASLHHTSGHDRIVVCSDDIVRQPGTALARLAAFLGDPQRRATYDVREAAAGFVDERLWHHRVTQPAQDAAAIPFTARAVFAALRLADPSSLDDAGSLALAAIDASDEQRALHACIAEMGHECSERAQRADRAETALAARDIEIDAQHARETRLRAEAVVRERHIGTLQEQLGSQIAALETLRADASEIHELRGQAQARSREIERLEATLRTRENELRARGSADARLLRADLQLIRKDVRTQNASLQQISKHVDREQRRHATEDQRTYNAFVRDVRSIVDAVVPPRARVLVAADGDETLLRLRGRRASHFPQGKKGRYAGSDPASSAKAVDHLEALRRRGSEFLVLTPSTLGWLDRFDGLREHLSNSCRLVHADATCAVYDLRSRRRLLPRRRPRDAGGRTTQAHGAKGTSSDGEYAQLVARVRDAVVDAVPDGSTVVVISKGDDDLLRLGPRTTGRHFPSTDDGTYAGHYPSDGPAAVAALDDARAKGGEFLVLPSTASWWLKSYPELRGHLERAQRVDGTGDACVIYDLRGMQPVPRVVATSASTNGSPRSGSAKAQRTEPAEDRSRLARVVASVDTALPADASVVVVSSEAGSSRLDVGRRVARRLPGDDGKLTATQAVSELERLRARGAEFLVVPSGSAWWRDRPGLRRHVEHRYAVTSKDRDRTIYDLRSRSALPGDTPGPPGRSSLKVSVLCWDMGHNPLGRAHVLAEVLRGSFDVEIVGPHFDRYGTELWKPLQESPVAMRTFKGTLFPEHFRVMEEVAERIDGDVLFVSKPRLPSFGLGMLAKSHRKRPLLLDCDDHETSFFAGAGPWTGDLQSHVHDGEFYNPHGAIWTRYCESITAAADAITVSNEALQGVFGGTIVPHARDEQVFDPARYDRDAARAEIGLEPDDRLILFAGTPRKHKGIGAIAQALSRIGNPRYKLGVIAGGDLASITRDLGPAVSFLHEMPMQPFDRLPAMLAAADLTCVLQDPDSEVSRYQIPAKITDAIAMGVPCIATPVPPLKGLIERGALIGSTDGELHDLIDTTLSDADASARTALLARDVFLDTFSYAAVRPVLEAIVRTGAEQPREVPAEIDELIAFQRSVFAGTRKGATRAPRRVLSGPRDVVTAPVSSVATTPKRSATRRDATYDIVVFWKHNDTGIYGRRQDMVVKHLAASERVNQIVHFDAPVDVRWLRRHLRPKDARANHARLLARNTLGRVGVLGSGSNTKVHNHTFLHRTDRSALGRSRLRFAPAWQRLLPSSDAYIDWIASTLRRHSVGDRTTVFWAYPKLFGFPEIADALAPDMVVSDVVDDDRTWSQPGSPAYAELTRNYDEILARSDLVIASTEQVRDAMSPFADEIHLVPNACEFPDPAPPKSRPPRELRHMRGPIVGYVGNLSSRIDVPLLEHLAMNRPGWNIVLIGSAHLDRAILRLQAHANVHVLGVKPYGQAKRYIRAFDVAIIPHLDDAMTRAMHPLKAFAYAAQNVPIVSTDIANLGDLRRFVQIGNGPWDFLWQVELAIAAGKRDEMAPELVDSLTRNSWQERTRTILELLDGVATRPAAEPLRV